jgi:hypothetical protein
MVLFGDTLRRPGGFTQATAPFLLHFGVPLVQMNNYRLHRGFSMRLWLRNALRFLLKFLAKNVAARPTKRVQI